MSGEITGLAGRRQRYEQTMLAVRDRFYATLHLASAGSVAVAARATAVDELVRPLWAEMATPGVALVAVGGYGRRELFRYSDVDLMFLLDGKTAEAAVKEPIRRLNQALWDCGLRVSPMTRTLPECEKFNPENVEFTLALLDARRLDGEEGVYQRFCEKVVPKLVARDRKKITARLLEVTRTRHARYGNTLFHLEPNLKDCPGGLRDAHVWAWLGRLSEAPAQGMEAEFAEARDFLLLARTFLHLRHERDDNVLDWHAQDEAATVGLGLKLPAGARIDAAYWMRLYFRHARSVERTLGRAVEEAAEATAAKRLPGLLALRRLGAEPAHAGFELKQGRLVLAASASGLLTPLSGALGYDAADDPEVVLAMFAAVARTGARCSAETEARVERALPLLSAHLEDGPGLWRHMEQILAGPHAGAALRSMHAMGILELVLPEFHGIDALVIRDAYHRYTVDEHTFVLIDTLHGLLEGKVEKNPTGLKVWADRFGAILRDLPHPGLLYLAALLHDTGKGHTSDNHPAESERMAANVVERLEMDAYESALVLGVIRNHLEMSAALRRDVFDAETVRAFASRVPTPEALRMLALFTYADIAAVHPDALTPWKAENLFQLYIATANYLDRNVDEERLGGSAERVSGELIHRLAALLPGQQEQVDAYLDGFPQRYLLTRTPEQLRRHVEMALRIEAGAQPLQLDFSYAAEVSELTLVTTDRPMLFASMAGALAAWGMNIVTADAFSNAHGLVVDSFRFIDTFRTLEMNESERERFAESVGEALAAALSGSGKIDAMLLARRRGRKRAVLRAVAPRIEFDDAASSHSTLLQVVALDTPGLLRALAVSLAGYDCNVEVAMVDTEGEMAIDVFYVTKLGAKLMAADQVELRESLLGAIEANAR